MGEKIVVPLSHDDATSPGISGAKAANIARSANAGLPTLPGFVLTTVGVARGVRDVEVTRQLRDAWEAIGGKDGLALVVRSSSTIEDAGSSSMAGRFTSVLDVCTWDAFVDATTRVIASADAVRDDEGASHPLAVLVQRQLRTHLGGVMFGVDPVTGDLEHVVVEAVGSRPDTLVGGTAVADHYVLSRRGRVLERRLSGAAESLSRHVRRQLVGMAVQAEAVFGSPQDIEWAVDLDGRLWLLQSRPVTAVAAADERRGIVFGPGPVAETFPAPLTTLEADLWIVPLRAGIVRALQATGAVSHAALDRSPVVTVVDGWAAVDLDLLGLTSGHTSLRHRVSPTAIARRLGASWRVGRLRVALPRLAASVVATVDRDLTDAGRLESATDAQLSAMLRRARNELATVHAFEVLCGMLLPADHSAVSAPLLALQAVHDGRAAGWSDDQIVARTPVALALTAPSLSVPIAFGADVPTPRSRADASLDDLAPRDALRLRIRWLQELQCRIVSALADRLVTNGAVPDRRLVFELSRDELDVVAAGHPMPDGLEHRPLHPAGAPLPPSFRIGERGELRATTHGRSARSNGLAAGGGRAVGVARHRVVPGQARSGVILVTRHLEPQLAPLLPSLDGLVAETGSALSHLAILAREMGVPTVVGVEGALQRFPSGTHLLVDGATGVVEIVDSAEMSPAPVLDAVPS